MAELVGALLSPFLQVLFERLATKDIPKLFRGKQPIEDVLREVRNEVKSAMRLVNDAEEKQISNNDVKEWLDELNDVVYRADDLFDTIDAEKLRREMEHHEPSSFNIVTSHLFTPRFDDMVKNEATEILRSFKSLLEQKDDLGLRDGLGEMPSSQRPPAPLAEESSVYGRKGDKEAIIDLLLSSDGSEDNLSVIPIVGMGGIGKTTLAQLVYDDARVKDHFDLRAWVTVSDDFDIYKLSKIILKQVTSQKCQSEELFGIQHELKDALRGKKFLLIHDDVWNENYQLWDCLKSSFESGAEGSKIIVTTRSTVVASVMASGKTTFYQLTYLSPEECWLLFSRYAFRNNEDAYAHQDLQSIGREIVKKCKGLPLAIKSLGGLLRSERNPRKWENILKSDAWNELYGTEKNILPALWLSYRRMPTHLKRCFSYCAIFPKDYEFKRERIILMWMAEGFLQSNKKSMTMEEVGEDYFEDLVSRSLFQKSSSQDDLIYVMHDLVHDLAMFVSRGYCFGMDESNDVHNLPRHTRHLSYSQKLIKDFGGIGDDKYLRTFIASGNYDYDSYLPLESFWTSGRYLRVLGLHGIMSISDSINSLIHLRYLDLSYSGIKEFPASICSLYNLQTLLLSWCYNLTMLPKNMERLINLRHLDIYGTPIREMNFQIKDMKSLLTLSKIVVGWGDTGMKIKEVKQVQPFMGKLEILGIENVGDANEALEADLKDKKSLTDLHLEWSYESASNANSSEREREILDSLRPHRHVKYLRIEYYRGTIFPDWVGLDSFSNIVSMRLENCKSCCILPPLGQLPCLKNLTIAGFDSMVSMGDELYCSSTSGTSFRSLEFLWIYEMAEWKEWSFGGDGTLVFPRLRWLRLQDCPELNIMRLPNSSDSRPDSLSKLEELTIWNCKKVLEWDILHRLPALKVLYIRDWEGDSFPGDGMLLPTTLAQIEIWICSNLKTLNSEAFQQLTNLKEFSISDWEGDSFPGDGLFLPTTLATINILECSNLSTLNGEAFQQLTNLKQLYIAGWKGDSFPGDGMFLPTSLAKIDINHSSNLAALNGEAFQQLTNLEKLNLWNCPQLQCLPEEGLPASLSKLTVSKCHPLLKQRCENDKGEDWDKIAHIPHVSISSQDP